MKNLRQTALGWLAALLAASPPAMNAQAAAPATAAQAGNQIEHKADPGSPHV